MALINMRTAARILDTDAKGLQAQFQKLGLPVIEGPKFGKGNMRLVSESDVEVARQKLAELATQKRNRIVEVGKRTRIVPNALMMEKLDQVLEHLADVEKRLHSMHSSLDALHIRVGNLTQLWGCNESNTTVS